MIRWDKIDYKGPKTAISWEHQNAKWGFDLMLSLLAVRHSRRQIWSAPKTAATETVSRETATTTPPIEAIPPVRAGCAAMCVRPAFLFTTSLLRLEAAHSKGKSVALWVCYDWNSLYWFACRGADCCLKSGFFLLSCGTLCRAGNRRAYQSASDIYWHCDVFSIFKIKTRRKRKKKVGLYVTKSDPEWAALWVRAPDGDCVVWGLRMSRQ